jgi:hypothetical protein
MPNETLTKVMNDYEEIAKLHKDELTSTQEMVYWNASYTQLLKLERLFTRGSYQASQASKEVQKLLKGTFAEMHTELPKMVSTSDLPAAEQLYAKMKSNLAHLVEELQPAPDSAHSIKLG